MGLKLIAMAHQLCIKKAIPKGYVVNHSGYVLGALTSMRMVCGIKSEFTVGVDSHRGSTLSSCLFALVVDKVSRY